MLSNKSVVFLVNDFVLIPFRTGVARDFLKPVIHLVLGINVRRLLQSCELPPREDVSTQERVARSRRQQHEAAARGLVVAIGPWCQDKRHSNEHGGYSDEALHRTVLKS